ncbi:hypothetical protein C2142_38470 [Streptomyces sp. CB01881]|nr:hypothetical protein C2142_38470 [Streptomyces sp. CB01881]
MATSFTLVSAGVETHVASMHAETETCGTGTGPIARLADWEPETATAGHAASGRTPRARLAAAMTVRLPSRGRAIFVFLSVVWLTVRSEEVGAGWGAAAFRI